MSVSNPNVFNQLEVDTSFGPSQALWQNLPLIQAQEDPRFGAFNHWNFRDYPNITTPTITTQAAIGNGWKAFGQTGGTVLSSGEQFGGITLDSDNTDNDAVVIAQIATPYRIGVGYGDFAIEGRISVATVTTNPPGIFFGLMASGTLANALPLTDASALADINTVGLLRTEGDGDALSFTYKADGVTAATVKADITPAGLATGYSKWGLRYFSRSRRLYAYFNGVQCKDYYTVTETAGNPFPNDVNMGVLLAVKVGGGTSNTTKLSWVQAFQAAVS